MGDQTANQADGSSTAARAAKAYFQLLSDLAVAGSASCQVYADQITPDNIFAVNSTSPWISATTSSLNKIGDLVPKAWQRYWNSL